MDTFAMADPDDLLEERDRRERRREREFYKYYEPMCALSSSVPSHVNLFDKSAASQHIPRSSPDRVLTALCQLGALRLQARRCLLFFFDRDNAYVLAEATRSLSLINDDIHDEQDALWLGNVVIPRGISVCEHTVNISDTNLGSNQHHKNADIVHIINNLTEDTRFCDRPFVTEGPLARFYAGVPIVTPAGSRIGAFCILDDKPRDGLSDKDVAFLTQMGETVFNHIETVRSRAEFSRGSRMLTGMQSFFSSAPALAGAGRKASTVPEDIDQGVVTRNPEYFDKIPSQQDSTPTQDTAMQGTTLTPMSIPEPATPGPDTFGNSHKISPIEDELDLALEQNIKTTFGVAATLIRSAADVDGMVFLDTQKMSTEPSRDRDSDMDSVQSLTDNISSTDGNRTTDTENDPKAVSSTACPILGSSVNTLAIPEPPHIDKISVKLLRSLLRRYPNGKVWYFDREGGASLDESDGQANETLSTSSLHSGKSHGPHRQSRSRELQEIQELFPGVRALSLLTLTDHGKNRIYAGSIMWTYSPVRIITTDGDLAFLRAFSDVIMSNVARLTSRIEEQAKSNFISSISHELRSPLHGILGSIDYLQEQQSADQSVVTQIERCSVTLMDVIEHLLEFAKINNLSHGAMNSGRGSRVRAWLNSSTQTENRVQSLTKLVEEVADAIFYSHCCVREPKDHGNVAFVLDVASEHLDGVKVPVGAWKRLCINIINNALKYTKDGHISVSLKATHRSRRRSLAVLTVTDTGCGMSRDFLEHNLFRAFSQENTLTDGTGLGMSLVAKLVRNMNGKIEVQSTKNVGTTIKVSIPIEARDMIPRPSSQQVACRVSLPRAGNDPDLIKRNDRTLQHIALERACKLIGAEPSEDHVDVSMIDEADLARILQSEELKHTVATRPIIVLCTSFASAATLKHSVFEKALDCHIEFIPQPYGPTGLAQAIKKCLANERDLAIPSVTRKPQSLSANTPDVEFADTVDGAPSIDHHERSSAQHTRRLSRRNASSHDEDTKVSIVSIPADAPATISTLQVESPSTHLRQETLSKEDTQHRPLSLMIVDDNQINVRVLMTFADKHNYPRITASNGEEAVQAYEAAALAHEGGIFERQVFVPKPDVVLMDLQMPICDGFEATRRIRAFEKSRSIPRATIIALTGLGSNEAHQQARAAGIDIFLTKPVRPRDLRPLLESIEKGMRQG